MTEAVSLADLPDMLSRRDFLLDRDLGAARATLRELHREIETRLSDEQSDTDKVLLMFARMAIHREMRAIDEQRDRLRRI